MKKFMLLIAVFSAGYAVQAQQAARKVEDVLKFKEVKYNFGKIKQGVPVTHDFLFTNIGDQPAIIENATASCGCTTPSWPQTPVMKGKDDKITAGFNAASPGTFDKGIYVKLKGIDYPFELKISGEVLSAEDFAKYEAGKKSKTGSK